MFFRNNNCSRFFLVAAAAVFFLAGFLGLVYFNAAGMDSMTSGCPLMPGTGLCGMAPLEHLSLWQSLFTALPNAQVLVFALLILALAALAMAVSLRMFVPPLGRFLTSRLLSLRNCSLPQPILSLAFSDGILHSKEF